MKTRHILFLLLAVLTAATSCVYDYNPQIEGEGGYLIVEGNIVIGDMCNVRLDYSWSLVDTTQGDERWRILSSSKMYIEDSSGGRYENRYGNGGYEPYMDSYYYGRGSYGLFDLQDADPSLEYRLVIENEKGTYASVWQKSLDAGEIDDLSYKISDDGTTMSVRVSAHSDDPAGSYYRWSVRETWEYHADVYAIYTYLAYSREEGEVVYLEEKDRTYRCWTTSNRPEIMTASTGSLTEDRLVDHELYTLNYHDERVSVIYSPEVVQMRIPADAYKYWEMMDRNSRDVGGLFSPEPSEYRGNVVNLDKPEEMVLGYVGVMSVSRKKMFVDNSTLRFYRSNRAPVPPPDTLNNLEQYALAYRQGMLPATDVYDEETGRFLGYEWWPVSCVDCRRRGGTLTRPDDWPD